jgi:hypothetical protein
MRRRTALVALALPAAAPARAQEQGYLCCNLRSDGAWISDSNYAESGKTLIPFGTPVRVLGQGRYRVLVVIAGRRQAIGNDYSRDLAMDAFQRRYVVAEDPRPLVAALPEKLRHAIETARVTPGMTRGQVAIAIGWPMSSENPHLDARVWKYWLWSFSPFEVHFDDDGRVRRVTSDPDTLARVFLP